MFAAAFRMARDETRRSGKRSDPLAPGIATNEAAEQSRRQQAL